MPAWKHAARVAVVLAVGHTSLASTVAHDTAGRTTRGTGRITVVRQAMVHILKRLGRVLWMHVWLKQAWHISRCKAKTDSGQ